VPLPHGWGLLRRNIGQHLVCVELMSDTNDKMADLSSHFVGHGA
jgi:hypothetical protein